MHLTQSLGLKVAPPGPKFGSKKIRFFCLERYLNFQCTRIYYYTDYFKSNYARKNMSKLFLNVKMYFILRLIVFQILNTI